RVRRAAFGAARPRRRLLSPLGHRAGGERRISRPVVTRLTMWDGFSNRSVAGADRFAVADGLRTRPTWAGGERRISRPVVTTRLTMWDGFSNRSVAEADRFAVADGLRTRPTCSPDEARQ